MMNRRAMMKRQLGVTLDQFKNYAFHFVMWQPRDRDRIASYTSFSPSVSSVGDFLEKRHETTMLRAKSGYMRGPGTIWLVTHSKGVFPCKSIMVSASLI